MLGQFALPEQVRQLPPAGAAAGAAVAAAVAGAAPRRHPLALPAAALAHPTQPAALAGSARLLCHGPSPPPRQVSMSPVCRKGSAIPLPNVNVDRQFAVWTFDGGTG